MDHFPSPIASLCGVLCPKITQMDGFMAKKRGTAVETICNTTRNYSEVCVRGRGEDMETLLLCNAVKFKATCVTLPQVVQAAQPS